MTHLGERQGKKNDMYCCIISIIYRMRIHLLVFLLSIYRINSHGQHGGNNQPSTGGHQHISRKMEDYVHDVKYKNSF
jgi:hypothetical protein